MLEATKSAYLTQLFLIKRYGLIRLTPASTLQCRICGCYRSLKWGNGDIRVTEVRWRFFKVVRYWLQACPCCYTHFIHGDRQRPVDSERAYYINVWPEHQDVCLPDHRPPGFAMNRVLYTSLRDARVRVQKEEKANESCR